VVLKRRAVKMLETLEIKGVELSIALVDDATIQELNRDFRKKDKPTDVLSFPLQEMKPRATYPDVRGLIGDVIISVPTARKQAGERDRALLAELTMLLAHGVLHLLGWDHRTDREEARMTAATERLEAAAS
jgi:probable rRNA maturation factor